MIQATIHRYVQNAELVIDFIVIFKRMEYALKCSGFLLKNRQVIGRNDYRQVEPAVADWESFGTHIEKSLFAVRSKEFDHAASCLFDTPPRTQIRVGETFQFTDKKAIRDQDRNGATLFKQIVRVHENLFHGGDYTGDKIENAKNEALIRRSLEVLLRAVELDNQVKHHFEK